MTIEVREDGIIGRESYFHKRAYTQQRVRRSNGDTVFITAGDGAVVREVRRLLMRFRIISSRVAGAGSAFIMPRCWESLTAIRSGRGSRISWAAFASKITSPNGCPEPSWSRTPRTRR